MVRPNYQDFRRSSQFVVKTGTYLEHSAKGSTWEDHKYIKRIDGTYYYPDSYEGGRHLPDGEKDDLNKEENNSTKINLSKDDIENLAKEVIRGNFGNGQIRKDLLGGNYAEVQEIVNELMNGSIGQKKISEATTESIEKAEKAAKNADSNSNVRSGINMDEILSVYRNKK